MKYKNIIKIISFNAVIILLNILIFTGKVPFLSFRSEVAFYKAFAITLVIMSVISFFYVNYHLIVQALQDQTFSLDQLNTPKEYIEALKPYLNGITFREDVNIVINQIERLLRKKATLEEVLFQNYREEAKEFDSLKLVVEDTSELLFENVKKVLNRMCIFDEQEYARLRVRRDVTDALREKLKLLEEHIRYIKMLIEKNETILLEFDNLLLEVSRLDEIDSESMDELSTIQTTIQSMKNLRMKEDEFTKLEEKYDV